MRPLGGKNEGVNHRGDHSGACTSPLVPASYNRDAWSQEPIPPCLLRILPFAGLFHIQYLPPHLVLPISAILKNILPQPRKSLLLSISSLSLSSVLIDLSAISISSSRIHCCYSSISPQNQPLVRTMLSAFLNAMSGLHLIYDTLSLLCKALLSCGYAWMRTLRIFFLSAAACLSLSRVELCSLKRYVHVLTSTEHDLVCK